jgi:hypothetical protein
VGHGGARWAPPSPRGVKIPGTNEIFGTSLVPGLDIHGGARWAPPSPPGVKIPCTNEIFGIRQMLDSLLVHIWRSILQRREVLEQRMI